MRHPIVLFAALLTLAACDASRAPRVTADCRSNADCAAGATCEDGACVPPADGCRGDSDCDPGQACVHGICVEDQPEWTGPSGPRAFGAAGDLRVDGDRMAVSTFDNLLRSDDGGETWTSSEPFTQGHLDALAITSQGILVHNAFLDQVLVSLDDGESWTALDEPAFGMEQRDDEIFVFALVGEEFRTLRSTDGGRTFAPMTDAPSTVFPVGGRLFGSNLAGDLHVSTDGETWEELSLPSPAPALPVPVEWNDRLLVFSFDEVHVSDDGGHTWSTEDVPPTLDGWLTWTQVVDGTLLRLGATGSVLRRPSLNDPWDVVDDGTSFGGTNRVDAAYVDGDRLVAIVDGRLARWDDDAQQFVRFGGAPIRSSIRALAADGRVVWAVTDDRFVHRSEDGGRTWTPIPIPGAISGLTAIAARGGTVWLGTRDKGILRSTDGGATWDPIVGTLPAYDGPTGHAPRVVIGLLATGDGDLYLSTGGTESVGGGEMALAATSAGVWVSNDEGDTWRSVSAGLPPHDRIPNRIQPLGPLFEAAGTLFVSASSGLYRSADHGGTWVGPTHPVGGTGGVDLRGMVAVAGGILACATPDDPTTSTGLVRSEDGGATWSPAAHQPEGDVLARGLQRAGDRLYLLGQQTAADAPRAVVWRSNDDGASWSPFGAGTPPPAMSTMTATVQEVIVGTHNQGAWRLPTGVE